MTALETFYIALATALGVRVALFLGLVFARALHFKLHQEQGPHAEVEEIGTQAIGFHVEPSEEVEVDEEQPHPNHE